MYFRLQEQILHEKEHCEKHLSTLSVREFLCEQEGVVHEFCDEYKQLNLADEKCDLIQNFYGKLYLIMKSSPQWQGKSLMEKYFQNNYKIS